MRFYKALAVFHLILSSSLVVADFRESRHRRTYEDGEEEAIYLLETRSPTTTFTTSVALETPAKLYSSQAVSRGESSTVTRIPTILDESQNPFDTATIALNMFANISNGAPAGSTEAEGTMSYTTRSPSISSPPTQQRATEGEATSTVTEPDVILQPSSSRNTDSKILGTGLFSRSWSFSKGSLYLNHTSTVIPLWSADMLGNAYGGGFITTPSIYLTIGSTPTRPIEYARASQRTPSSQTSQQEDQKYRPLGIGGEHSGLTSSDHLRPPSQTTRLDGELRGYESTFLDSLSFRTVPELNSAHSSIAILAISTLSNSGGAAYSLEPDRSFTSLITGAPYQSTDGLISNVPSSTGTQETLSTINNPASASVLYTDAGTFSTGDFAGVTSTASPLSMILSSSETAQPTNFSSSDSLNPERTQSVHLNTSLPGNNHSNAMSYPMSLQEYRGFAFRHTIGVPLEIIAISAFLFFL